MSGGGGGIIILQNARLTLEDQSVRALMPQKFIDIVDPILAKPYEDWSVKNRIEIYGVLLTLSATVAVGE